MPSYRTVFAEMDVFATRFITLGELQAFIAECLQKGADADTKVDLERLHARIPDGD